MKNEIMQVLQQLANQLSVSASRVYEVLIRQAALEAPLDLALAGGLFLGGVALFLGCGYLTVATVKGKLDDFMPAMLSGLLAVLVTLTAGVGMREAYLKSQNPEYYAIEHLLSKAAELK